MIVDTLFVYAFVRKLRRPFKNWEAYKKGVIDENGNVLKKKDERKTPEEKRAFTALDKLILNLKKLIPGGDRKFASFAATMLLVREGEEILSSGEELTEEQLSEKLDHYREIVRNLHEEAPTVNAGDGNVAGIGVGEDGEPGFTKDAMNKYKRKNRKNKMHTRKSLEEK